PRAQQSHEYWIDDGSRGNLHGRSVSPHCVSPAHFSELIYARTLRSFTAVRTREIFWLSRRFRRSNVSLSCCVSFDAAHEKRPASCQSFERRCWSWRPLHFPSASP